MRSKVLTILVLTVLITSVLFVLFTSTEVAVKRSRSAESNEILCIADVIQGEIGPRDWVGFYSLNAWIYPLTPVTNDGSRTLIAGCGNFNSLHSVGSYHLWINIPYWSLISLILSCATVFVFSRIFQKPL